MPTQLLVKQMLKENMKLTIDQVYSLFQREFPHVRYLKLPNNTYRSLLYMNYQNNKRLKITLIDSESICADSENDEFILCNNCIILNAEHIFQIYNKPCTQDELLSLLK